MREERPLVRFRSIIFKAMQYQTPCRDTQSMSGHSVNFVIYSLSFLHSLRMMDEQSSACRLTILFGKNGIYDRQKAGGEETQKFLVLGEETLLPCDQSSLLIKVRNASVVQSLQLQATIALDL
jgi:hypothetical protein